MSKAPTRNRAIEIAMDIARRAERALGGRIAYADGGGADNRNMSRAISERAMRGLDPTPEQQKYLDEMQALRDRRGDENLAAIKSLGDLVPDPIPMPNAQLARQVSNRAMAGRDDYAFRERQHLADSAEGKEARARTIGELAAEFTGVPQAQRAGVSIGDAISDPSLVNVTDAGVQSALAFGKPLLAGKAALAGLGIAGIKDAGLLNTEAVAQARKKPASSPRDAFTPLEGLTEQQNAELARLKAINRDYQWETQRDREMGLARIKQLEDISNDAIRTQNTLKAQRESKAEASKQDEYNRAVERAETAKAAEMARDKRFSDTDLGKFYDKYGILTPALFAAGAGALSKAAGAKSFKAPMAVGSGTGAVAANWPLMYNSYFTEPDNPERKAYEAYVRELPDTHPDKAKWKAYVEDLPKGNPLREVASEELYNPMKLLERSGIGAVEGLLAGLAGAEATKLPGRGLEFLGSMPGRLRAGYEAGNTKAAEQAVRRARVEGEALKARASLKGADRADETGAQLLREADELAQPAARRSPDLPAALPEAGPTTLADLAQRQLPPPLPQSPASIASLSAASSEPVMFNGRPLPPGWGVNSRNLPYNIHTGYPVPKEHYTPKGELKRSQSRKADKKAERSERKSEPPHADEIPNKPDMPIGGDFGPFARGGAIGRALAIARNAGGRAVLTGPVTDRADGGRTDTIKTELPSHSYVLPSDTLSSLGEGDTNAGYRVVEGLFGPAHTRAEGGSIPAIVAGGEYVLSPEQVAKIGNGDPELGFEVLDTFVRMQRRKHIQTLKKLPPPVRD